MKAQIQTRRTLTETLFSTWSSSLNSLVNTFFTFWISVYIFARYVRICAETSDQEGEPSCEEPPRTHKPHSFLPAWKVSIQSFLHSSTIYQSTISCLSTSDQSWVHFSLLAALTILIMQPARLQHLPQQTERSVNIVFVLLLLHIFFSCPGQLNRWPCHSLTHSLSESVSESGFDFSDFREHCRAIVNTH